MLTGVSLIIVNWELSYIMKAAPSKRSTGTDHPFFVRLTELCLRLARYKSDNKELLTYLLSRR